jgi:P-type Cu+ transporter
VLRACVGIRKTIGVNAALKIGGMTCQSCARNVRDALQRVEGVHSAVVNLDTEGANVRFADDHPPSISQLIESVKREGYSAHLADTAKNAEVENAGGGWRFNVILGLIVSVPLMVAEWIFHFDMHGWFGWLSFVAVAPVQFICGWRFYRGAWQQLKVGQSNMDTLVALGSTTAFGISVYGLFAPEKVHHLYFAEAAAIITLISIGHYLEARAGQRAAGAVRSLLKLAPQTARRLRGDGSEEVIPISELQRDDKVVVRPGDQIPTDGVVVDGASAVDESMLTGEPIPIDKSNGAELYAGTVNENGRLVMRVTSLGEETALARIIDVVENAQNSRADIQRIGDRVSSIFVPVVIVIAIGTVFAFGFFAGGAWETGLINAAAVLIVACPCAMGLATPAAIMAGTNAAAKRGILIRNGTALEKAGRVTAVLFDKTGTLTEGKPRVQKTFALGVPDAELNALALGLVKPSQHPLSQALTAHLASVAPAAVTEWTEHRGAGVSARFGNHDAVLGSVNGLKERGIYIASIPQEFRGTVLAVGLDRQLVGAFLLTDSPKDNASAVIAEVSRAGLTPYIVSGDSTIPVTDLARVVGIPQENVFASVRPEEKAKIVQQLQAKGERVAFVGDGINDAPALAQADLGIAVTKASDVARETADILLLKSDIEAIPEALGISQATLRTIKQNLFWAFFYNAAAVPLAAVGWISPILCAAAMALSDLFVIGNALRLLRWRR